MSDTPRTRQSRPPPTAERVRELLNYDPLTGIFTWRSGRRGTAKVGTVTKTGGSSAYLQISIDGRKCYAQVLARLYMMGDWPTGAVGHEDGNTLNNAFRNLREESRSISQHKRSKLLPTNSTGFPGVYRTPGCTVSRPRYVAIIKVNMKQVRLGTFGTPERAYARYLEAKQEVCVQKLSCTG